MAVDVDAARAFVTTHARLLDRLRLERLIDATGSGPVLAALAAYRNEDGGYGWGIEPDLRSAGSQPVGAMHALEVLAEAGDEPDGSLFQWLEQHTLPDGGLPFALPIADPAGCAQHWLDADPEASSLQMTAQVAANAHLLVRRLPEVGGHPWLGRATRYCLDAIARLDALPQAYELIFVLRFLDALDPDETDFEPLLARLRPHLDPDGSMAVAEGVVGERLRLLDFSPFPGTPSRRLFTAQVVAADVARLAGEQQADGGWPVGFATSSPAAALEWRGYATVQAVAVLLRNHSREPVVDR